MSGLRSSCCTRRSRGLRDLFHQKARSAKTNRRKTKEIYSQLLWKLRFMFHRHFTNVDSKLIILRQASSIEKVQWILFIQIFSFGCRSSKEERSNQSRLNLVQTTFKTRISASEQKKNFSSTSISVDISCQNPWLIFSADKKSFRLMFY